MAGILCYASGVARLKRKGYIVSSMATNGSVELSDEWHRDYSRDKTVDFLIDRMFADAGKNAPAQGVKDALRDRVEELYDAFD
jgi:hypothetical protein